MNNEFEFKYIAPTRVVWHQGQVENLPWLLSQPPRQAILNCSTGCLMKNEGAPASVLLDFGKELHGHVVLWTGNTTGQKPMRLRIRYGESVSEAMSELHTSANATNDHAVRDQIVSVPWLGNFQASQSGFRFVRIDLMDTDGFCELRSVWAFSCCRNIPYLGCFECSDERLNQIWQTGAYTVHLNMQEYLWDGIKRDRLVWIGDMHPETMSINTVFGYNDVVPRSLDLVRDTTALPNWMNGISSYSLWWILVHHNWYYYQGNLEYLKEQSDYLMGLLRMLFQCVDEQGREKLPDLRFLDWPTSENKQAVHAGLHSLLMMTFKRASDLCGFLGKPAMAQQCIDYVNQMRRYVPKSNGSKSAGALLVLAGLADADKIHKMLLKEGGCRGVSTFYGYYVLEAMARAGAFDDAIGVIKSYWGAMIDLGATTFWEDFNIDWINNAAPIDEIVPEGKKDIHGDYGGYCYKGFRHSLCHGWASGPTPWLSEHVLGVKPVEPGFRTVSIKPRICNFEFIRGEFPTPYGNIKVYQAKTKQGTIETEISAPKEVKIV